MVRHHGAVASRAEAVECAETICQLALRYLIRRHEQVALETDFFFCSLVLNTAEASDAETMPHVSHVSKRSTIVPRLVLRRLRAQLLRNLRQTILIDALATVVVGARQATIRLVRWHASVGRRLRQVCHSRSALFYWQILLSDDVLIKVLASFLEGTAEAASLAPVRILAQLGQNLQPGLLARERHV